MAKKNSYNYAKDHNKSLQQLAKEAKSEPVEEVEEKVDEPKEEPKEEKIEEKKLEDTPQKSPLDEAKEFVESQKKTISEEAARVAKEEAEKAFKEKMEAILDKDKSIAEKQKEADELISIWDKENRLPKDYKEIVDESLRLADAKFAQREKEKEERRLIEEKTRQEEEIKRTEEAKRSQEEQLKSYQRSIADDLDDLYSGNFLKRPSNIDEINNEKTTDEAAKETQELFKFGVKLNIERKEKGLPPVGSLSKIYFMHYKPFVDAQGKKDDQPAGADAPVSGAKVTKVQDSNRPYVYARDHNKSFRQIALESMKNK